MKRSTLAKILKQAKISLEQFLPRRWLRADSLARPAVRPVRRHPRQPFFNASESSRTLAARFRVESGPTVSPARDWRAVLTSDLNRLD